VPVPQKLSALVISYNRAGVIGTCLRALSFADEVIVVDKSSTDETPQIAARYADRVITVPWTPIVEDTRAFAVAQCVGDWILCLDDDECLGRGSGAAILGELAAPSADIYYLPQRHYILGVHDEAAYYWPEHQPRLFRRGAVEFIATVHGGTQLRSGRTLFLSPESGVEIHHLSHRDVAEWVAKCNRYTSRPDRERPAHDGKGIAAFACARLDHWQQRSREVHPGSYTEAVAVLRAVYDIIDRLKTWEEERGLDGEAAFARICRDLDAAHPALPGAARAGQLEQITPPPLAPQEDAVRAALLSRIAELRSRCEDLTSDAASLRAGLAAAVNRHQEELAAERTRGETLLRNAEAVAHVAAAQADALRRELTAIETSHCWRATAGIRFIAQRIKRLSRYRRPRQTGAVWCEWSE